MNDVSLVGFEWAQSPGTLLLPAGFVAEAPPANFFRFCLITGCFLLTDITVTSTGLPLRQQCLKKLSARQCILRRHLTF